MCVGFKGVAVGHKDRYAAHVLNTILGGGVSSRRLRQSSFPAGNVSVYTEEELADSCAAWTGVLPKWDGLVHISQLAHHRVQSVSDEVSEGEQILVKVLEVDRQGKIRLSRKEAMAEQGEKNEAST